MSKQTKKPKKDFSAAVAASTETNGSTVPLRQPVERRRYKQKLPVRIDDAAVALLAEDMAKQFENLDVLEEERRAVMMKFKEKLSAVRERMNELAANVRSHTVSKSVECVDRLIAETGTIECVRLDTGETFATYAAKALDLQDTIDFPEGESDEEEDQTDRLENDHQANEPEWTEGANPRPSDASP